MSDFSLIGLKFGTTPTKVSKKDDIGWTVRVSETYTVLKRYQSHRVSDRWNP